MIEYNIIPMCTSTIYAWWICNLLEIMNSYIGERLNGCNKRLSISHLSYSALFLYECGGIIYEDMTTTICIFSNFPRLILC